MKWLDVAGVMDSCFVENPVQEMLGCGVVALLRSALDEREESVVFAATHCLASLIAPQVRILEGWYTYHVLPTYQTPLKPLKGQGHEIRMT